MISAAEEPLYAAAAAFFERNGVLASEQAPRFVVVNPPLTRVERGSFCSHDDPPRLCSRRPAIGDASLRTANASERPPHPGLGDVGHEPEDGLTEFRRTKRVDVLLFHRGPPCGRLDGGHL